MSIWTLWLACGVWALFVSIPLIAKLWDKYTYWVMKNFADVRSVPKVCPKCGSWDLTYNSDLCYGCYYDTLAKINNEKQVQNG